MASNDIGIRISATDDASGVFGKVAAEAGKLQSSIASVRNSFGALAGVGALTGAALSFAGSVKDAIDLADSFNKLSQKSGVAVESLSKLNYAAGLADVSTESLGTALKKLNVNISAAAGGSAEQVAVFKALGISIKDASGNVLSADKVMAQLADRFAESGDGANKTAVAIAALGKSGADLIPLLNAGSKGLAEMGDEAKKLGIIMGADFAKNAEEFNDNLHKISISGQGLFVTLAGDLVKGLGATVKAMAEASLEGGKLAAVIAGIQTLFTGDDMHKNNVAITEQTGLMLSLEKSLVVARASGNAAYIKSRVDALAAVNAEIKTTMAYRQVLQGLADDKVKADKPKPTQDSAGVKAAAAAIATRTNAPKVSEYQRLNEEIDKQNQLVDLEIANGEKLTESQKYRVEAIDKITNAYINGKISLTEWDRASEKALNVADKKKEIEDTNKVAKANLEAAQAHTKYIESLDQGLAKLQAESEAQSDANDRLGLSKIAIAELDAAKLESQAVTLDLLAVKKLDKDLDEVQYSIYKKQADELRKLAGLKVQGAEKETALDAAKAANDEWKRGWEETDRISREVFTAWATEGGSAAKIIGDTLKKALLSAIYEAPLKPLVFQVYASLTGGGGASAALQAASGVGSTASGIGGLGNFLGAGSALANVGSVAQGVFLGSGELSSLGFGEAVTSGLGAVIKGSFADGFGTLAGVLGPVALGIGALSFLKSAMDYKVTPTGSGVTATLGAGGVASGSVSSYRQFEQQGGLFGGGTTTNRDWSMADAGTTQYINEATKAGTAAIKAYAAAIGLSSTSIDSFIKSIDVSLAGLDPEQAKAAINKAIGGFFDDMVSSAYADIASLSKPGEAASATLQRVATDFVAVTHSLDMLGFAALKAGADSAKAAASIIDSFGGLDRFNASVGYFYEHFFSEGERAAKNQESTKAEFAKLNLDMPTSKEAYRKLVEDTIKATDANSESSRKFLADLLSLAPAFDSVANSAANAATAATAAAAAHQQAVNAALANYGTPEEQKANALKQIQAGLASGGVNLSIEQISKASRADARALWEQYMALAAQGNKNAQAAADAILAQQDAFAKITSAYGQGGMTGGATGGTDPGGDRGVWGTNASITYDYADSVPGGSGGATSASKAWKEATDAIKATMADLRKTLIDNGPDSFARIQAQFAIELAQAKAGDAKAAKNLPDLAKEMIAAQKGNSASALDEALFKARLVEQLASVVGEDPATAAATAAMRAARDAANVAALAAEELINAAIDRANSLAETKAGEVSGGRLTHLYDGPVKYWRDYQTDSPFGIPSYDVGTNYVPKDMIAQIHKGEAIVPVAYNPMANGNAMGGNGYTELVAEVRALRAEVAAQRPALDATASNTGKTVKVLDAAASGGQPLGVTTV